MNLAMEDSERLFISKRMKRVGVMLVHVSEPKSLRAIRVANQDQSTADGDVFVTTWNDGNNATWEGNLYYIDYDSGAEYSNDIQLDVSNSWRPPVTVWSRGGFTRQPRNQEARLVQDDSRIVRTRASNNVACSCTNIGGWGRCALQQSLEDSVFGGCGTSFALCAFTGPWYFGCVGGACYGTILTGYLKNMRETIRVCDGK